MIDDFLNENEYNINKDVNQKKKRENRGLASLNRSYLNHAYVNRHGTAWALNSRGCTTRKSRMLRVCLFMDALVSHMCISTQKVGVSTANGFFVYTWEKIADLSGLKLWEVHDAKEFALERGWITSTQPKEIDADGNWTCLASVKRVTNKYFRDLDLFEKLVEARKSAVGYAYKLAKKFKKPVEYIQCPITLLRRVVKQFGGVEPNWFDLFSKFDCNLKPLKTRSNPI